MRKRQDISASFVLFLRRLLLLFAHFQLNSTSRQHWQRVTHKKKTFKTRHKAKAHRAGFRIGSASLSSHVLSTFRTLNIHVLAQIYSFSSIDNERSNLLSRWHRKKRGRFSSVCTSLSVAAGYKTQRQRYTWRERIRWKPEESAQNQQLYAKGGHPHKPKCFVVSWQDRRVE